MTKSVGVHEAKTQLSRLLTEVAAGDEVIISNRGVAVARIVPYSDPQKRTFGSDRDTFSVPDDFDASLPEALLDAFEA